MKKLLPVVLAVVILEVICMNASAQRQNAEQLYLMTTEVVKADKLDQYTAARTKLVSTFGETGFPHPYILWKSRDNYYHIWYPIDELNDIHRINSAWDSFSEKFGKEVVQPYLECVETSIPRVMLAYMDLSYEPPVLRLREDETNFCRLKYLYLKKGSGSEVKERVKEVLELYKTKGVTSGFYFGEGEIGFETPLLLNWMFARDLQDYLQQESKNKDLLGDEYERLLQEISHHVRKTETLDFQYLDKLSYQVY